MHVALTRTRIIVIVVLALGIGGYFLVDWLVVTERDHVQDVILDLAEAVEQNDFDVCAVNLDNECRLLGRPIANIEAFCRAAMECYPVDEVDTFDVDIRFDENDPDRAVAKVQTSIRLRDYDQGRLIDWELVLVRRGERDWRVIDITPYDRLTGDQIFLTQIEWLLR